MPIFGLQLKATLENVNQFSAPQAMYWNIKFMCSSCNEMGKHSVTFSAEDEKPAMRGTVNLVSRCHFCGRSRTADVLTASFKAYTHEDQPNFKTVVQFECRGMQPMEFTPGEGWQVEALESGEKFVDVDLREKEWVEYDSNLKRPIGIYQIEYSFVKVS